ncbi:MAG: LpxD N-terminal domain-containing protein [Bacteroidales bacterium]
MEFTAAMIAGLLNGTVEGDPDTKLNTIARIEEGHAGALSFLSNLKYEPYLYTTGSSAVLVKKDFMPSREVHAALIRVDDPYQALARLLTIYDEQTRPVRKGIHPTAVIEESAVIGKGVYMGAHVYVAEKAVIGDGCSLYPNVYIGDGVTTGRNRIGAQSGIMSTVSEENAVLLGSPAVESKQFMKSIIYIRKLPDLSSKIDELTKSVESLKNR